MTRLMRWVEAFAEHIGRWLKDVPHLPDYLRAWLGGNVWWIAIIGAAISSFVFFALLDVGDLLSGAANRSGYFVYRSSTISPLSIFIKMAFMAVVTALLLFAISPLRKRQSRGWLLLFAALCVVSLFIVVDAILSLSVYIFILSLIFGSVFIAALTYIVFEVRDVFFLVSQGKTKKDRDIPKE